MPKPPKIPIVRPSPITRGRPPGTEPPPPPGPGGTVDRGSRVAPPRHTEKDQWGRIIAGAIRIPFRGDGDSGIIWPEPIPINPEPIDRPPPPIPYTDREFTQNAKDQPFPVIYGTVRCGGKVVFYKTDATQTQLAVDIIVSEGPIEAIRDIKFGEYTPEELNCIKDGSTGSRYKVYLGTSDQGVDPLCNSLEPLYCSGKPGTAHVTFLFDGNDPLCQKVDIYAFKCTVDGLKIRDPRLDPTLATRYFTNGSNLPPGKNNALATLDLLTDPRYGAGFPDLQFDWLSSDTTQSWKDAANDCDYSLASRSGAPASAPTVAEGTYASGQMFTPFKTNYVFTYFVNGVEGLASQASADFTTTVNYSSALVTVTPGPAGTTERRIYRRKNMIAGGIDCDPNDTAHYLCGVIHDNTTTEFRDVGIMREPTLAPGSVAPCRYQIGLWMGEQKSLEEWLNIIRATYSANFNYDGKYHCWIDKARAPSGIQFDESNIIGDVEFGTVGLTSMFAKVKATFVDSEAGFKNSDAAVEIPTLSQPPTEDEREEKRVGSYDMTSVPTYDQTMRLLRQILNRSRMTRTISFTAMYRGLQVMAGQVVQVTHRTGPLSSTKVIVTGVRLAEDGSVGLSGEFYDALTYSDQIEVNPTPIVTPPDATLPPAPPTNCAVTEIIENGPRGERISRLKVTFTPSASPYATVTRVTVEKGAVIVGIIEAREGPILIENPELSVEYQLLVQAVGPDGRKSVAVILSITPQGPQTAPNNLQTAEDNWYLSPIITDIAVASGVLTKTIDYPLSPSWTPHTDPDVFQYRLRWSDDLLATWGQMTKELIIPASQVGSVPTRPSDISGLVLWCRSHDSALADGTAMSTWLDYAAGHTFQQLTTSLKPKFTPGGGTTRPGNSNVYGDGVDDYMDAPSLGISSNTGFLYAIVVCPRGTSVSKMLMDRTSNTTARCSIGIDGSGYYGFWLHDDASGSSTQNTGIAVTANAPVTLIVHRDIAAGYVDMYVNGVRYVHWQDTLGALTPPAPRIMSLYDGSQSSDARFFEIIAFNRSLSAVELAAVNTYLLNKYPYIVSTGSRAALPPSTSAVKAVRADLAPFIARRDVLTFDSNGVLTSFDPNPRQYKVMVLPEKYNARQGGSVTLVQREGL